MSDRAALAALISRVRWAGLALCLAQAFLWTSRSASTPLILVLALVVSGYNVPAALSARLPSRFVEPVIATGLVGDFVACTAWLLLNPGEAYGVGLLAYVVVAIEAGVTYQWVGAVSFLAALAGSVAAVYWRLFLVFGTVPSAGLSIFHAGVVGAAALISAAVAGEAARLRLATVAAGAMFTQEHEALRQEKAERHEAEAALRTNEESLRAVVQSAPVMMFAFDRQGVITLAEGVGLAALERKPKESVGFSVWELYADQPAALAGMRAALLGKPAHAELEEAGRLLSATYGPLRHVQGHIVGAVGVLFDMTDQRTAERALDEQSALYEALVDAQSDLGDLVILVEDGKAIYVNEAVSQVSGYSQDELTGMTLLVDLVPVDERAAFRQRLERIRQVPGVRFDATIQRKDGARLAVEVAQISIENGGHTRVFMVARDVTDRKQAEEARRALLSRLVTVQEEERHQIANDIHDDSIQTMFGVGIRLHLLRTMLTDSDQLKVIANLEAIVDQAIGRLRHLVFDLRPTALDHDGLVPALRLYLDQMRQESSIGFDLRSRLSAEPPPNTRVMLYRLIQEALMNVRKHARARTVSVSLEEREGGIWVRVQDDGQGFTVSQADKSVPGHLGLAAMRGRTEMAGGWVEVDSEKGKGTTVDLWIPREVGEEKEEGRAA